MFIRMSLSLRKMLRISSAVLATHKITVGELKVRTLVARGKNLRCHAYFEFSFCHEKHKISGQSSKQHVHIFGNLSRLQLLYGSPCGHHVDISFKLN